MKRYWVDIPNLTNSTMELYQPVEMVKYDDIKDSLIVWHRVEDELPLQPNTGIIIGMSIHGFLWHIYWAFGKWFDARTQEGVSDIIQWAYIKLTEV